MTGRHTGRISVRGNREHQPVGQMPMAADEITVAQLLKQAGYVTGAFGKWGLGYPGSVGDPLNKGFDVFFGYNCQRNAHTFYPTWLYDNAQQIALDGKTYSHDLIVQRALKFLRENKDGPFFCYLPFTIPHAAMHVPDEYCGAVPRVVAAVQRPDRALCQDRSPQSDRRVCRDDGQAG
jgi:arylsulfatase A